MKKIIILFIMVLSLNVFADTAALKDKNGIVIIQSEWSESLFNNYNSGDTFEIGVVNDTGTFIIQNKNQSIYEYVYSVGKWNAIYENGKFVGRYIENINLKYYAMNVFNGSSCVDINYILVRK